MARALGFGAGRRPAGASGSSQLRVSNYPTWSLVIARAQGEEARRRHTGRRRGGGRMASASTKVVTSRVGREYYSAVVESHHVHGDQAGEADLQLSTYRYVVICVLTPRTCVLSSSLITPTTHGCCLW